MVAAGAGPRVGTNPDLAARRRSAFRIAATPRASCSSAPSGGGAEPRAAATLKAGGGPPGPRPGGGGPPAPPPAAPADETTCWAGRGRGKTRSSPPAQTALGPAEDECDQVRDRQQQDDQPQDDREAVRLASLPPVARVQH